ncbi:MAG: AEC family transporter [Chloroflexi bacterium]|nr:AEC family transporter [Chloroflexota bacterium]MCC6891996.1 AEC family transporter [Anaerolineae bacterium]
MAELLHIFADNLLPILLIAAVGFYIKRRFDVHPRTVSTLLFNVFSPSLVFSQILKSRIAGDEFIRIFFATILFQLACAFIAYWAARLQRTSPTERANLMIGSFCLNAGNFGLSLVGFAFNDEVFSRAIIVFIANIATNYSLGTFIASNGHQPLSKSLLSVAKTPAVWALISALIVAHFHIELPLVITRSIDSLGNAALPLMLVLLGLELGQFGKFGQLRLVATGVVIRLLLSPFIALGLGALLGITGPALTAFVIQASMPTAVLTIIFTTEFNLERDLALNIIMASTLLSPITLSILIYLFRIPI